ncbi:flagellar FliJ family protein [Microbacterium sediminis]|uniref:Uncharacterized protein n=1 Tax=Microbacterium sediminis TaxID=904291 RepID=A0A1B9NJ06_9MICO|nr:flagellar FliJ family protein [Microbacterium sediminis]OCG76566.1 hypothetical protein A7J15_11320 [Microbacterium sediminis]QBR73830.1 hypothetical protein E3O41_04930 [Microbacterium sediminis]
MTPPFSLAGLLRLRGVQERAAAERLSRAAVTARQSEAREHRTRTALADSADAAVDVRSLAAIAASRAAARARIGELALIADAQRDDVDAARRAHTEAKRRALGLEKLEAAHRERERRGELRAEQSALDEIATGRWAIASARQEGAA